MIKKLIDIVFWFFAVMFWWIFFPAGNLTIWLLGADKYGSYNDVDEYFEFLAEEGEEIFGRGRWFL